MTVPGALSPLDDCPYLPRPDGGMDWRILQKARSESSEAHFRACLKYGQFLWRRRLVARALLALDRALLNDFQAGGVFLALPYRAIGWVVRHTPDDVFTGNPRIHYQHLAGRVRGEREEQKRWRAWACWWLVRLHRPDLPGDPKHQVGEPGRPQIANNLALFGLPGEPDLWRQACEDANPAPAG